MTIGEAQSERSSGTVRSSATSIATVVIDEAPSNAGGSERPVSATTRSGHEARAAREHSEQERS